MTAFALDRAAIAALIPHRDPFLLLDGISEITPTRLFAEFTVSEKHPLFAGVFSGHYPQNPVTPGVLLNEIIFQAGAVLLAKRIADGSPDNPNISGNQDLPKKSGTPVITRIRDARFKRIVKPNETVQIEVELAEQISHAYYLDGKITVNGELAVKVSFTCALIGVSSIPNS